MKRFSIKPNPTGPFIELEYRDDGEFCTAADALMDIAKHRAELDALLKQMASVEKKSSLLASTMDDFYQGYMNKLNHMSGWPELREVIEWFADNNFYGNDQE